jgi:hypothetical protein
LLDLLVNRDLLGHDHVATLRSRLEQRQLDRRCDFVWLLVLAAIREAILAPDAIGQAFADIRYALLPSGCGVLRSSRLSF